MVGLLRLTCSPPERQATGRFSIFLKQTQICTHRSANRLRAAHYVARFRTGGVIAGITNVDREILEDGKGRPEGVEQGREWQTAIEQQEEIVGV